MSHFKKIFLLLWLSFVSFGLAIHFLLSQAQRQFNQLVLVIILTGFSLLVSYIVSKISYQPLKMMIERARATISKNKRKSQNSFDEEELDTSELVEFEKIINAIEGKFKHRAIQIAHERESVHALMGSLEDAVVTLNLEDKIVSYNSSFARLFLQSSQVGKFDLKLSDILQQKQLIDLISKSTMSNHSRFDHVKLKTIVSDQDSFFSVTVSPLRDRKTKEIFGILVVFHDITSLKKTEIHRQEFIANASHELRTPLTSIKGYLMTLLEDYRAKRFEDFEKFLNISIRNSDRLQEIIEDMLKLSYLDSKPEVNLQSVEVFAKTQSIVEELSSQWTEKKIQVKVQCDVDKVQADAKLLRQVIVNLLANAIKFSPEGTQIQITWLLQEKYICLSIKDQGKGISEEHLDRVFERFYRIDGSRSRKEGGSGLGLAIVKHSMIAQGGFVKVYSKPNDGADFRCYLPK